jgi:hypothetical protein
LITGEFSSGTARIPPIRPESLKGRAEPEFATLSDLNAQTIRERMGTD